MSDTFQPKSIIKTDITEDIDADTKAAFELLEDLTMEEIQATATGKDIDFADLDALIDMHDSGEVVEEVIEKTVEDHSTPGGEIIELTDDEEAILTAEIAKQEVYENTAADESGDIATLEPAAPSPTPSTPRVPKVSRATKTSGARVRSLDDVAAEHFVLSNDFAGDLDANKKLVISARPSQIKVADKFDNVFLSLANKTLPSAFVTLQFKFLAEKETATTKELVALLQAAGYKEGTARAQVGQITTLFPILGIATRSGSTLHLRENSQIAETLADLIAASEKAAD